MERIERDCFQIQIILGGGLELQQMYGDFALGRCAVEAVFIPQYST